MRIYADPDTEPCFSQVQQLLLNFLKNVPLFANLDSAGIDIIRVDGHHLPKLDSGRGLQQQIRQDTQAKKYKTEQL